MPLQHDILNLQRFDTLRYRHFDSQPTIGKSLYNVQHFPNATTIKVKDMGAHRLVPTCPPAYYNPQAPPQYIRIHHYLGSWESYYTARPRDPRRDNPAMLQSKDWTKWQRESAACTAGPNNTTQPWLAAFVRYFGRKRAQYLLADVGVIVSSSMTAANTTTTS